MPRAVASHNEPLVTGVHAGIDQLVRLRFPASRLDFGPSRTPRTASAGGYFSRFRGRGMEFEESRAYLAGDDIRSMDWKVTARTGQPHTKVFREERERPVLMVVDFRATMFFGTRVAFKSVVAAGAAGLLSWVAINRGDRVGALVFSEKQHQELRPAGGRRGVLGLLRIIAHKGLPPDKIGHDPDVSAGSASLEHALDRARRVARPGSLIFIFSDFYHLSAVCEHHLMRLGEHNDAVLCWITDPLESEPPPPGRYVVSDGKRRAIFETRGSKLLHLYRGQFETRRSQIEKIAASSGLSLTTLNTDGAIVESLRRGLARFGSSGSRSSRVPR